MPDRPSNPGLIEELYERPGFLLRRAHQLNAALFEEELGSRGITHTQYGLLMAIASYHGIDGADSARLTGADRTTAHIALRNLEREAWIERRVDPSDARRHLFRATAAGLKLLKETRPALRRVTKRLLSDLTADEADTLVGLLRRVGAPAAVDGFVPKKM